MYQPVLLPEASRIEQAQRVAFSCVSRLAAVAVQVEGSCAYSVTASYAFDPVVSRSACIERSSRRKKNARAV